MISKKKRKQLRFSWSKLPKLHKKRPNFECDYYIFPKTRGNKNKQCTHSTFLKAYRNLDCRNESHSFLPSHDLQTTFKLTHAFSVVNRSFIFLAGCTPLNTVPTLFCVKAYSKNRHFRVFRMIKIGQTHIFPKDCVHIHQIGSHFVGGYRLDFSPGGQETRRSFFKLLALGSPRLL